MGTVTPMFFGFFGLPLVLIVVVVLLVLAGKSEADPRRERPATLYLSAMTLLGVLGALTATYLVVHGLVELTDTSPTSTTVGVRSDLFEDRGPRFGTSFDETSVNHDDDVSSAIGGLILGVIAAALLWFHVPRLRDLADNSHGPGARIYARLLYVVSAITLLVGLTAAGMAIYALYGIIAPDTAGTDTASEGLRNFITAAALTAAAAALFQRTWTASEDLAAIARSGGVTSTTSEEVIVVEPPAALPPE